jgi:hypothetical protein
MDKKVLALAYDEKKSFLNPSFMYKKSDYFDRLFDVNSIKLLHNIINLETLFCKMVSTDMPTDRKALSNYIVYGRRLYQDHIANIIKNCLKV